ncbi:hypothetical protein TPY_2971 [Sulfobacillus acidophilus TPY]|nr:hypothetical protein TPY_2971 [Sulfobacillus acidophilus TPY]
MDIIPHPLFPYPVLLSLKRQIVTRTLRRQKILLDPLEVPGNSVIDDK